MKLKVILLLGFLITLVISGCSRRALPGEPALSAYEQIHRKLTEMENYRARATVEFRSNRSTNVYETIQVAKMDGRYRVEVTGPENVVGYITLFDGSSIFQFNPRISAKVSVSMMENPERTEIFVTSFVRNYMESAVVSVSSGNLGNNDFTILEASLPGTHPYLVTERLWVNNKTLFPERLVIYDGDQNERIVVIFHEFEYNITLEEDFFTLDKVES